MSMIEQFSATLSSSSSKSAAAVLGGIDGGGGQEKECRNDGIDQADSQQKDKNLDDNATSRIDWENSWDRADRPPSSGVIVTINYPQH